MSCLNFKCDFNIIENPLNLKINDFLDIAVRNNPKRRFLFVSKPLGKHLPCKAEKMDELGKLIVEVYNSKKISTKSGTVISFAETGTAIGHSVFDYIEGDYEFIHTTREIVEEYKSLDFLEEHSHATDHKLYFNNLESIKNGEEIILVDDEITTAKTCMNIIKKIQSLYPKRRYTIGSILNWMDDDSINKIKDLEKELNCIIECVYLFKGSFEFTYNNIDTDNKSIGKINNKELDVRYIDLDMDEYIGSKKYVKYTGRFGITKEDQDKLKDIVKREKNKLDISNYSDEILFLGTEEFMYIPMLFAKECVGNICYHSITRSPIIEIDKENYPIKTKFKLNSFYNPEVVNYVYNLDKKNYKECYLFVELKNEKEDFDQFIDIVKNTSIERLSIVCCR